MVLNCATINYSEFSGLVKISYPVADPLQGSGLSISCSFPANHRGEVAHSRASRGGVGTKYSISKRLWPLTP